VGVVAVEVVVAAMKVAATIITTIVMAVADAVDKQILIISSK
jgi:hypothetical protein